MTFRHNSRSPQFRSPFGAVPCNTTVHLSCQVDSCQAQETTCTLRIWVDGEGETLVAMDRGETACSRQHSPGTHRLSSGTRSSFARPTAPKCASEPRRAPRAARALSMTTQKSPRSSSRCISRAASALHGMKMALPIKSSRIVLRATPHGVRELLPSAQSLDAAAPSTS